MLCVGSVKMAEKRKCVCVCHPSWWGGVDVRVRAGTRVNAAVVVSVLIKAVRETRL